MTVTYDETVEIKTKHIPNPNEIDISIISNAPDLHNPHQGAQPWHSSYYKSDSDLTNQPTSMQQKHGHDIDITTESPTNRPC